MCYLGKGDNAMENGKLRRKRLTLIRDFVFFLVVALLTLDICGYFKSNLEAKWHRQWMRLVGSGRIEHVFLNLIKDREGTLYETCSPSSFVAAVKSCSSNQVNNVWYVGSTNGFDCFIHNSDFMTQRFRVPSGKLNANYMMPMTNDVFRWIQVTKGASGAAADLGAFLNGERLPHPSRCME